MRRIKVILGSTSEDKKRILTEALKEIGVDADVDGVQVKSEISDYPWGEETKKGSLNRARNAKKVSADADFWFGMEGGWSEHDNGYHLITYVCMIDNEGKEYVGEGIEIHLPQEIYDLDKKGDWNNKGLSEYAKDHDLDINLITRELPFKQAIWNAYSQYTKESN